VQRHLCALARDPGEQQHRGGDQRAGGHLGHLRQHVSDAEAARGASQHEDAEQKADVAEPGHQERLDRGARIAAILPPVADEEVGAQAHDLPAHVEDEEVARVDHEEHGAGEQADEGAVGGVAGVVFQVADRIDLHGQGHERHQHSEQAGEVVGLERERDRDAAGVDRAVGVAHGGRTGAAVEEGESLAPGQPEGQHRRGGCRHDRDPGGPAVGRVGRVGRGGGRSVALGGVRLAGAPPWPA
jgi:hypothetical protein